MNKTNRQVNIKKKTLQKTITCNNTDSSNNGKYIFVVIQNKNYILTSSKHDDIFDQFTLDTKN